MKTLVPIFIIAVLCSQCSAQKHSTVWKVENVKTNYVQKGTLDTDYFTPPKRLIGTKIHLKDNRIILSNAFKKRIDWSNLIEQFGDTIYFEKAVYFKRREDDDLSRIYPGDELIECVQNNNNTCFASEAFLNLLEVKGNGVNAYLSSSGRHSKTKCILFILKENKEAVLFSENDFLLLFLTKKQ